MSRNVSKQAADKVAADSEAAAAMQIATESGPGPNDTDAPAEQPQTQTSPLTPAEEQALANDYNALPTPEQIAKRAADRLASPFKQLRIEMLPAPGDVALGFVHSTDWGEVVRTGRMQHQTGYVLTVHPGDCVTVWPLDAETARYVDGFNKPG